MKTHSGGSVREKKKFSLVNGLYDFQLIYKKIIQQHYLKNKNWYVLTPYFATHNLPHMVGKRIISPWKYAS